MGLFGNNSTVTTTFKGRDELSPIVRGMRNTMEGFKRERKLRRTVRKMHAINAEKFPGLVEQHRQLVQDIKAELEGLPGYTAGLAEDVIADLASIGTTVTGLMGYGEDGHMTPVPKKHRRRRRNRHAIGGTASGEFVAGEYGPEVVRVGAARVHVSSAHASRGGMQRIYLDGKLIWDSMNERFGRDLAYAGMGE